MIKNPIYDKKFINDIHENMVKEQESIDAYKSPESTRSYPIKARSTSKFAEEKKKNERQRKKSV